MKRYFACLAVVLVACSSPVERSETSRQDAPAPSSTSLPPSEPYVSPCDRPTRYEEITVDGKTYSIPIFVMCDPYASDRDLGDPPPDELTKRFQNISDPAPIQR